MKLQLDFQPKLFTKLRNYNRQMFVSDLIAGLIVGIVALPLAIAFGIASGVSPVQGLITAIIGGFIVSLLGGSNVQIGGPTGAFIVIVAGVAALFVTGGGLITAGGEGQAHCQCQEQRNPFFHHHSPLFQHFQHLCEILDAPVAGRILGNGRSKQMTGFAACIVTGLQIADTVADHDGIFGSAAVFFH